MDIFRRFAPFIQDYIYQNNWTALRGIQVAAAEAIFGTEENVLLTAATASGKTEAAFFPILTLFTEAPPASVGAIYIGPLKALINDQFLRLNDLCREAGVPVWHWHGDVQQSHKGRMLRNPSGILQITPESLEAMLLRKHALLPRLFGDLRFIVIDEVHSLLRGDRGGQTICLIERLAKAAGVNPRRIGLSATIGDPESTGRLLATGTGRGTIIPKIAVKGVKWRLSLEHFYIGEGPQAADGRDVPGALPLPEPPSDSAPPHADPGLGYIFEHTRGRKCLVFVNSREECEAVTTGLRQCCEAKGEPERFLIHHGNLSTSIRESAEADMKDEEKRLTTCTTATLELGIDIGRLERAFQIDAPFTVSSFLQRMGRTGRREAPPEMWFVIREDPPEPRAMLPVTIPWKLIQALAIVQVYLDERWCEPPRFDRIPYSLLYHQTMCILASQGEMTHDELAQRVLALQYFHRVSRADFDCLVTHLLETDQLQTTAEGGLIVGLAGERQTSSYKFFAVFQENVEYTCRWENQELGTLCMPPPPGEKIAIAGRVWVVEEVDHKRHLLYCTPIPGKVPAYFGECPGDIHTRILLKMRDVLAEDRQYPYLMRNAAVRLADARADARAAGMLTHPLINLGGDLWVLFPWLGTYAFLALERLLKRRCAQRLGLSGLDSSRPYYLLFHMKLPARDFYRILQEEADQDFDPMELVYPNEVPLFEKYDPFLPPELVRKGFARGILDLDTLRQRIHEWTTAGFAEHD